MAGGRGERLGGLTAHRCKPATPFGGKFRIIDFVLSNCVNSGIRQISVLTQYKAQSLIQHVHRGWSFLRGEFAEFVEVVPAQQQTGGHWYLGTADAVYQNLELILSHRPKHVLVLAGDHIYKMDYGPMIAYHVEKGADITVGVVEVPVQEARSFGVMTTTEWNRIIRFSEKPANPDPMPGRQDVALASMGIYVFNTRLLEKMLVEDAFDEADVVSTAGVSADLPGELRLRHPDVQAVEHDLRRRRSAPKSCLLGDDGPVVGQDVLGHRSIRSVACGSFVIVSRFHPTARTANPGAQALRCGGGGRI